MSNVLERLYPHTPVWMQNVGISCYGLLWKHERLGGEFARYAAEFKARERWSAERMADHVNAELRRILPHAFRQTPYYRDAWRVAGIPEARLRTITAEELPELPITPKRAVREAPEEFVACDVARGSRLHRQYSSGSTGTPITLICTADGHRRFLAAREARSFGWAGVSIRQPRAMIGGRIIVPRGVTSPPFHRFNLAEKQVYLSAFHIAPANVPAYVAALNRYRPGVLTGYATCYFFLGRMMIEQKRSLDYTPDAVILTSEKLTQEARETIEEAFGARAFEEYGSVENRVLATECERGKLHVSPDFGVMEIVDAGGSPVPPGVTGRVLCTGLLNDAQPLVRYEIGDLAAWSGESCACGRNHLPVLEEVVGRLDDVLIGPDGREVVRFHGVFHGVPHLVEAQIVQETLTEFSVNAVVTDHFGNAEESLIRERLGERLGEIHVTLRRVPALPRTERGKLRAVICKLDPEEKARARARVAVAA